MKVFSAVLLSGVMLASSGCFMQKKPTVRIPVPPPSAPTPAATPDPTPKPPIPIPAETVPAATPTPSVPSSQEPAKPSPFPPVTSSPPRSAPPVRQTPPPPTQTQTPVPTPAPALGAVLSADQRKQLDAAYLADLGQANQILGRVSGKSLTAEQKDSVSRARAFIRQAGQYHDRDLATAAELARRARVLTQDLASELK